MVSRIQIIVWKKNWLLRNRCLADTNTKRLPDKFTLLITEHIWVAVSEFLLQKICVIQILVLTLLL